MKNREGDKNTITMAYSQFMVDWIYVNSFQKKFHDICKETRKIYRKNDLYGRTKGMTADSETINLSSR